MAMGKVGLWAVGGLVGLLATFTVGMMLQGSTPVEVLLEPANASGPDPFIVLDTPEIDMGVVEPITLGSDLQIKTGIEPGLYGGSGSDHFCDPALIGDFLAANPAKGEAWAEAAGIEPAEIDDFLSELTPVRLLGDTLVTNHGFRNGKATPRQSVLQAGTMVLVDDLGVPRVRCKCGNPLQPPQISDEDLGDITFAGEAWDGFDPEQLLTVEPGAEPVEWFALVRLEDGQLVARPTGTLGESDIEIDDGGAWVADLELQLPALGAVGDGPFALPPLNLAGAEVTYVVAGPCQIVNEELVLTGQGRCVLSARSEADPPWAPLERSWEIEVAHLDQAIQVGPIETVDVSGGPVELAVVADSVLPVESEVTGPCEIEGSLLIPTGTGICEVTLTQPGNERWGPADPVVIAIEVTDDPTKRSVALDFELPATIRLDGDPLGLTATTNPRRPVSYLVAGACSLSGADTLVPVSAGDCEVVAVASGDDRYQGAAVRAALTVLPARQVIDLDSLPQTIVLGAAAIPLPATTSAGFAIDYQASGNCRVGPRGLELTGAGRCDLVASAGGDANTEPVTERLTITINAVTVRQQSQTVTFPRPSDLVVGGAGVRLSASATSGLPVALTVTDGGCRLSGTLLSPIGAGRCTIVASQAGDVDYEQAASVSQTITVAKRTPSLTITVSGGSATEMIEGENRTVTGAVSAGPTAVITGTSGPCTTSGPTSVTASSQSGSCVVTVASPGDADHLPVSGTVTIQVKQRQVIDLTLSAASMPVDGRVQAQASSSAGLPVTLAAAPAAVCALDGETVIGVGPGRCTITATAAGNGNVTSASASAGVDVVAKRVPVVTITAPAAMVVGQTSVVSATSSEPGVAITIALSGGACQDAGDGTGTVVAVASGTCTVTATHPATVEAEAGSAQATITVTARPDTISLECIRSCDMAVGQDRSVSITSQSGLTPSASVTGPCTIVGEQSEPGHRQVVVRGTAAGTCTLTGSTAGDATWQPASGSVTMTVTAHPATVSFELGQLMYVGETRSLAVNHDIPTSVVVASITGSAVCEASIDPTGRKATVTAAAAGTCTVTVTVTAPGYAVAKHTDSVVVVLEQLGLPAQLG